jgi:putative FmdB family regulatory protein
MPIYEYKCEKCGTFEVTQRITEKPLVKCPSCRGKVKKLISNTVKKLISNTSFQLKGTGWYITDYARKGANGGDNGSKSTSESKPATESKSETKKSDSSSTKSEKSSTSSSTSA